MINRFVEICLVELIKIAGIIIMKIIIGIPIIVGVMKEANRFSFILTLMGCLFLLY